MKRFIIRSVYFLSFFAVFFITINVVYYTVISRSDSDFSKRLETLEFQDPDLDLVVLGASTTLDAFDAELLTSKGLNSYNFAIGGATIRTSIIQLQEYLKLCSERPKYVILGLNSQMVDTFDDDLIHPIVEVTMEDHKYTLDDVPILKFKWLGFEYLKRYVSKVHRSASVSYGQFRTEKIVPDDTEHVIQYLEFQRFIDSYWIGEIIKYCEQENLELILIEMPGYRITQNLSATGLHEMPHANGHKLRLYNYNSREFCEFFDPDRDWLGNSHLNVFGAEKFTLFLFDELFNKAVDSENDPL